jgi:hypothetical protein
VTAYTVLSALRLILTRFLVLLSLPVLQMRGSALRTAVPVTVICLALAAACALAGGAPSAMESARRLLSAEFRPPCSPLMVQTPYSSYWQCTDDLNGGSMQHWTNAAQLLPNAAVRIDGTPFLLMGALNEMNATALPQRSRGVQPLQTVFTFSADAGASGAGVLVTVTFSTPADPTALDLLQLPLTYVTFRADVTDGHNHTIAFYYETDAHVSVSDAGMNVSWSDQSRAGAYRALRAGAPDPQPVFDRSCDICMIDWGRVWAVTPDSDERATVQASAANAYALRTAWLATGLLPASDPHPPKTLRAQRTMLALAWDLGTVQPSDADGGEVFAVWLYDEIWSISWWGKWMRPLWRDTYSHASAGDANADDNDAPVHALLRRWAMRDGHRSLREHMDSFDAATITAMHAVGGSYYATLTALIHRQVTGATAVTSCAPPMPSLPLDAASQPATC